MPPNFLYYFSLLYTTPACPRDDPGHLIDSSGRWRGLIANITGRAGGNSLKLSRRALPDVQIQQFYLWPPLLLHFEVGHLEKGFGFGIWGWFAGQLCCHTCNTLVTLWWLSGWLYIPKNINIICLTCTMSGNFYHFIPIQWFNFYQKMLNRSYPNLQERTLACLSFVLLN